jgi:hypothetical protein
MTKSLYELGLEYDKEIVSVEARLEDCKQRLRAIRKNGQGFVPPTLQGGQVFSLEQLIQIYTDERDELRDKARALKNYYKKEG